MLSDKPINFLKLKGRKNVTPTEISKPRKIKKLEQI
jgi:hypothetical protein